MVKAKFPGKPTKHFQRRKVSPGINIEDFEGLKAAEDIYCRLSVFDFLFREEDEVSSFHGFSPHESNLNNKSLIQNKEEKEKLKEKSSLRSCGNVNTHSKILKTHTLKLDKSDSNATAHTSYLNGANVDLTGTQLVDESEESLEKVEKKNVGPLMSLSGKFILPTRSAHSSRVIKPNKRFLQTEGIGMPYKKQRLKSESTEDCAQLENVPDELICSQTSSSDKCHSNNFSKADMSKSSPIKVILRKPRLNIKSQPFSSVEGPFSSLRNHGGLNEGAKPKSYQIQKVVCGVCWTVRSYKFFKQARKFGIFACEPCRRFILKILKMEREKLLGPLKCTSESGNCQIRNSSFVSHQPFATPPKNFNGEYNKRCQGCWLYLCLKSFKIPSELTKRLANYLPDEIIQKYPISSMINNWGDVPSKAVECRNADVEVVKLVKKKQPPEEHKKVRNRQKLLLVGPRVKHVCRSASLVLGQPAATFVGSTSTLKSDETDQLMDEDVFSTKSNFSITENNGDGDLETEVYKKQEAEYHSAMKDKNSLIEKPVARMLQDLGRANCELLDGIELHEAEKKFAKLSIDFWESYDPEEVLQTGFPLLGFNPFKLKAVCFLCGSAGFEKLVHCASCCEPYHTFCVSTGLHLSNKDKTWWRLDWLCPKCTQCEVCLKTGGIQLCCSKCCKSYHSNCIPPGRAHISDNNWVCPSCLFCKSCNDSQVHVFIGNVPLCKNCFRQRKKGNFCPLCQRCYDENDYSTKMMECSDCKCWIHAKCEGLSDEKYQVLSNLPSTIEFICRDCCKDPPPLWSVAVNAELKAGYLNVIRSLSKNRSICSYLKTSPKKRVCVCQDNNRKPIHLKNLYGQSEITISDSNKSSVGSPVTLTDEKNADLGLLTPKLTKDDEESLQTVNSEFLNLVTNKDVATEKEVILYSISDNQASKNIEDCTANSAQLLSIACNKLETNSNSYSNEPSTNFLSNSANTENESQDVPEKVCTCSNLEINVTQPLSLMFIKNKALCDDYSSILDFNKDVEKVIKELGRTDILKIYYKSLRQIFPWFDPLDSANHDSSSQDLDSFSESKIRDCRKSIDGGETETLKTNSFDKAMNDLLHHDQAYYYIGLDVEDNRMCMLCKSCGEGLPTQEGRLLYCGQNEWVHVNCALWSSEVFEEIDGSLQNVHSAISRARLIRCFGCDKKGASVGCCARSCPSAYHFLCAINAECVFLENKEVFCKVHRNLGAAKEIHKEEDFLIARSVYVELDHKKKKDVLRNEVRLYVGSLSVTNLGEIIPELSDVEDILIPCEFNCSRLYWSCKEPWRLVRYYLKTKVITTYKEQFVESDTNYTVDHSLEFTPPPSPIDDKCQINRHPVDEKDIRLIINHIIDTICTKEDDNNMSEQTTTDLLPPELKEAIFEDLPHDLLDGISMHDIFTKMNFDEILSEFKNDKMEVVYGESSSVENAKRNLNEEHKRHELLNKNKFLKHNPVKSQKNFVKTHTNFFRDRRDNTNNIKPEQFINKVKESNWKPFRLLQVDGAMDISESDQSNDSCDMTPKNKYCQVENGSMVDSLGEDKPVTCARCHRTYRTNVGYERHLSTCNSHYLSSSESDSGEEEREKPFNSEINNSFSSEFDGSKPIIQNSSGITSTNNLQNTTTHFTSNGFNTNPTFCQNNQSSLVNNSAPINGFNGQISNSSLNGQIPNNSLNINQMNSGGTHLGITYKSAKSSIEIQEVLNKEPQVVAPMGNFVNQPPEQPIVEVENTLPTPQTIILQQMPTENVIPTFIPPYQQNTHQNTVQYITTIDNQDKFISTSHLTPGTFHIQSAQPIHHQPVVQNVPTVLGTIIQTNGVEQIVLNGPNPSIDVYNPPQNNVFITNTPMIVGMETVVSNTVMSSSQFISSSVPGMLAASSYSATTTQVFQATKPVIDIPQSYVVVNTNPTVQLESSSTCMQPNILQNNLVSQGASWNNLINCQDPYKLNKNVSYQTVTRQIIHEQKEFDGVKMINSTQETIVIEPISTSSRDNHVVNEPPKTEPKIFKEQTNNSRKVIHSLKQNGQTKCNQVKIVELPDSSSVCKEKPHQAVAPVVVKKIVDNGLRNNVLNKKVVKKSESIVNETPCKPIIIDKPLPIICDFGTPSSHCNPPPVNMEIDQVQNESETTVLNQTSHSKMKSLGEVSPIVNAIKRKKENSHVRKVIQEEPKISYEITSDDGFSFTTTDIKMAWEKVFETVQRARGSKGLPLLTENPFSSPSTMLRKMMGLGNNSMKYLLEQLPGASGCSKYKPTYHKKKLTLLEQEMSKDNKGNSSGCARTEQFKHSITRYDMFSWLASRHRRPPKLLSPDNDWTNGTRRANMNLPMAMRFRHLKETSNAVGVFRSDIHGRGLFCLRDIDSGEMVIEYAGEVIRSALTDKRERYYTAKGIGCYMFRIDDKFVVDATMKGNAARFINHSCEPNCYSKVVDILGKKHILIFAMRRILQGEELTYDYKFPLEEEKINCHCLSRRCRKYLN